MYRLLEHSRRTWQCERKVVGATWNFPPQQLALVMIGTDAIDLLLERPLLGPRIELEEPPGRPFLSGSDIFKGGMTDIAGHESAISMLVVPMLRICIMNQRPRELSQPCYILFHLDLSDKLNSCLEIL